MKIQPVYIVAARRTPQGRFLGSLSKHTALDLAEAAGRAAIEPIGAEHIDELILGNVIAAGLGLNPARQLGLRLGLPQASPAFSVNQACASGMLAVALAVQSIRQGEASVVLCGGAESMTQAPHLMPAARRGVKLGDASIVDTLLHDGLIDPIHNEHMAITAERLASENDISRARQDAFADRSHRLALQAAADEKFDDELVKLPALDHDEHPRADTTPASLASLKPIFDKDGSVTAGNASGINDGAAMLVLASADACEKHGFTPLAAVQHQAKVGCDPQRMGLGPVFASQQLCERAGLGLADFDVIELNEAFAAQALACMDQLKLSDEDDSPVNPHGGAIALGHPVGASGARLVVHLAHLIAQDHARSALGTLCVGGGMGIAMNLTRCQ